MRIAINTLGPSKIKAGIGSYVVNLIKELQRIDKENNYLLFVGNENKEMFKESANFKLCNVQIFNMNRLLRIFWEQFILPFILLKKGVDILHSPGFVSPLLKTTKQIVTIHDMTFFTHPGFHLKSKVKYFQHIMPISAKRADIIIADSENTKHDIIHILKVNPNKVITIHLGTKFKHQKKAKEMLNKRYGITGPFILFVGMIEPRKNISNLIKAFAKLAPKIKHQLVIVGKKGWMCQTVFDLVETLSLKERVIFTDYVTDTILQYLYSAADLFVYPSYYEGFGIPVIEAMACRCPVITSNNSSLKEIAEGAAILIKDQRSIEEIAKQIERVLSDKKLQQKLRQKGLHRAKQFTWEKTAKKTLSIYKTKSVA